MAQVLGELREPLGIGLAVLTGVANVALGVRPWLATLAAVAVFCVRLIAGLLWPTPPRSIPSALGGPLVKLSRRELEVAILVSQGLTNKQIARRLFLAERTVDNHVQHILNKLTLQNRAQIAAMVARYLPGGVTVK
jgi:DNA-binding CsgD family transcriptional regulator